MTAHDPRVTLTEAGRPYVFAESLWTAIVDVRDAAPRVANDADTDDIVSAILPLIHAEIDKQVASRLAPIRALLDEWEAAHTHLGIWRGHYGPSSHALRAALGIPLGAPVNASQDHDGAEGQGEGERAGEAVLRPPLPTWDHMGNEARVDEPWFNATAAERWGSTGHQWTVVDDAFAKCWDYIEARGLSPEQCQIVWPIAYAVMHAILPSEETR